VTVVAWHVSGSRTRSGAHTVVRSRQDIEEPEMSEGYDTHVDVDGDGVWDDHTIHEIPGGSVDVLADMNHDGRPDFVGHDYNRDGLIDSSEYDRDFDGRFETHMSDTNHNGWQDREVADNNGDGRIDLVGVDANEDGFFDHVVQDVNVNGHADTVLVDRNYDQQYDLIAKDVNENGRWDTISDENFDGRFDTVHYDDPGTNPFASH
jgi:hypothetical protein